MENYERPTYRPSVRAVQTYLYTISQVDPKVPRINPDGVYGSETANAVRIFQETYVGFGDGKVDYATWQALVTHYREAETVLSEPNRIAPFTERLKDGVLRRGDRSDLVTIVRIMMATMGLDYAASEGLLITDLFDAPMEEAVRSFQYANGLAVNGLLDRPTWDRMALAYNKALRAES